MDLVKKTEEAFHKAVQRAGGKLVRLQEKTGVDYAAINRLNSGKSKFKNLTLETIEKLFPELNVTYFRDEMRLFGLDKLSSNQQKLLKIILELDEDGQVDLLMQAARLSERRRLAGEAESSKHVRNQAS